MQFMKKLLREQLINKEQHEELGTIPCISKLNALQSNKPNKDHRSSLADMQWDLP